MDLLTRTLTDQRKTFFGMNFTSVPDGTNIMRFTDNWMLFLECAIPITVITLLILIAAIAWENEKRKRAPPRKPASGPMANTRTS
jgi:hypothetical protein